MTGPRIIDAVTLKHFSCVEWLTVLQLRTADRPMPRWVNAVRDEIWAGMGSHDCDHVLAAGFLGTPHEIPLGEYAEVYRIQVALNDGRQPAGAKHLGEAESMHAADKLNGQFITDDNAAYDLAVKRLGQARVFDTVDLLRECVAHGELNASEAQHIADAIRNAGRFLRRVHPSTLTAEDFG
jgi:hypothetical protein